MMNALIFDTDYIRPIQTGEKTATVRHQKTTVPNVGDQIMAITPDGEPFTSIEITHTAELSIPSVIPFLDLVDAAYPDDSTAELIESLGMHYDEIQSDDTVQVIVFEQTGDAPDVIRSRKDGDWKFTAV